MPESDPRFTLTLATASELLWSEPVGSRPDWKNMALQALQEGQRARHSTEEPRGFWLSVHLARAGGCSVEEIARVTGLATAEIIANSWSVGEHWRIVAQAARETWDSFGLCFDNLAELRDAIAPFETAPEVERAKLWNADEPIPFGRVCRGFS